MYPHARVFPMAVGMGLVDVFIRKVDAAVEGGVPVHHQNFAVVPVVHDQGENRDERVERQAPNAAALHVPGKALRQKEQAAHVIVDQAHIHAFGGLAGQDLQNGIPHFPRLNDKVFQKNEVLRALQRTEHLLIHGLAHRIIAHVGIPIHGPTARALQIAAQSFGPGVGLF